MESEGVDLYRVFLTFKALLDSQELIPILDLTVRKGTGLSHVRFAMLQQFLARREISNFQYVKQFALKVTRYKQRISKTANARKHV